MHTPPAAEGAGAALRPRLWLAAQPSAPHSVSLSQLGGFAGTQIAALLAACTL